MTSASADGIVVRDARAGDRSAIRSVLTSSFGRPSVADLAQALWSRDEGVALVAVAPVLFLEGDPAYYPQFGFVRASSLGFTAPSVRVPDAAFLAFPLPSYDPSVSGALVYNETFWAHDCVGLR